MADFVAEHLSKVTVAGVAPVLGADPSIEEAGDTLTVVSEGGTGCFVTPVQASLINFFSLSPTVFNTGESVTLSWNVEVQFSSILIDQGIGDVSGNTDAGGSVTFFADGHDDVHAQCRRRLRRGYGKCHGYVVQPGRCGADLGGDGSV